VARHTVYRGRTVVVDFDMDRRGIAEIAVGPELKAAVHTVAETEAKPYAISISPRSTRRHQHYMDSFSVKDTHTVITGMRRVAAWLFNNAPHAAAVEWGNQATNGEGHRVLGRTLDHLNRPSTAG
jgi:hypothetical protein